MTEPERVNAVIAQILESGKSYYYIAKLMQLQVVQVQRMAKSGRCQPLQLAKLIEMRDDCLRNVTTSCSKSTTSSA